jgi:preprotein translocase subunit SecD
VIFRGKAATGFAVTLATLLVVTGCSSTGSADGATAPSADPSKAGARATLELRPVLVERAPDLAGRTPDVAGSPGQTSSARPTDASDPAWITPALITELGRLDCAAVGSASGAAAGAAASGDPAAARTACSSGPEAYLLGPAELVGSDVARAVAQSEADANGSTGSRWLIVLTLTDGGRQKFAAATRRLAALDSPHNQFAVVVDGVVLTAPRVAEAITGGVVQLSGDFDRQRATDLAARLGG